MSIRQLLRKITKTEQLKTVCYVSILSKEVDDQEVERLLKTAQQKNRSHNITGILMIVGERFFQILEGEESQISLIYKNILSDTRHNSVLEIFNKPIKKQYFETYQSSFKIVFDSEEIEVINDYLKNTIDYPFSKNLENILDMLAISARY